MKETGLSQSDWSRGFCKGELCVYGPGLGEGWEVSPEGIFKAKEAVDSKKEGRHKCL